MAKDPIKHILEAVYAYAARDDSELHPLQRKSIDQIWSVSVQGRAPWMLSTNHRRIINEIWNEIH